MCIYIVEGIDFPCEGIGSYKGRPQVVLEQWYPGNISNHLAVS